MARTIRFIPLSIILIFSAYSCDGSNEPGSLGSDYESAAEQLTAEFNGEQVDPVAVDKVLEISKRMTLESRSAGILKMVTALKQDLASRGIDGSVLDEIEDFTIGQTLPGVGEYDADEADDGVSSQSYGLSANNPNLEHYECPLLEMTGKDSCVQLVDRIVAQVKNNINSASLHEQAKEMIEQDPVVSKQSQEFKDYVQQYLDDLALDIHTFGIEMGAIRAEYTLRDAELCDDELIDGSEIARLRGIEEAETIMRNLVNRVGVTLAPKGRECLVVGKAGGEAEAKIQKEIEVFLKQSPPICPDISSLNTSLQKIHEIRREGIDRGIKAHIATIWVATFRNGKLWGGREQYIAVKIDGCEAKDQIKHTTSPLVLDLDGDGLELSLDRVRFDLRATGQPQQVTWASKREGFLALDLNQDGRITSGRELFGNRSLCDGERCRDGAAALSLYDDSARGGNEDGRIDAGDEIFSSLKIWVDDNQDGRSQAGELAGLDDHGVTSISLRVNPMDQRVPGGRLSLSLGVQTDRGSLTAYDVWFDNLVSPGFPSPLH